MGVLLSVLSDRKPFGEITVTTTTIANNLRFTGQHYDEESGLHYNYFRDYDPETGRYIQSDPIGLGGGISTYGYVGGNPVKRIDPLGLFWPKNTVEAYAFYRTAAYAAAFGVAGTAAYKAGQQPAQGSSQGINCVSGFGSSFPNFSKPSTGWEDFEVTEEGHPYNVWPRTAAPSPAPPDPDNENDEEPDQNNNDSDGPFNTEAEAAAQAEGMGYSRTNYRSRGRAVYRRGNSYITRDFDGHNGGAWKMAHSVRALGSRNTRLGTYNRTLTTRIGD